MACWNTLNNYKNDYGYSTPGREECKGYLVSDYKSDFTTRFKEYNIHEYQDSPYADIEETWNCFDRSGKKIQIYMNTITGKLKFT